MLDPFPPAPKPARRLLAASGSTINQPRQRRLMFGALLLLLAALASVLYADRDFWFPDNQAEDDQSVQGPPQQLLVNSESTSAPATQRPHTQRPRSPQSDVVGVTAAMASALPPIAISERTVLPPLEVEVVAGNVHHTVRPSSNAMKLDLQPGSEAHTKAAEPILPTITAASERVEISAGSSAIINQTVKPSYPMLARQMKVQGSVILEALIGRDGLIQNLRVVSGPPILARAAQEAVKQWHFKPHFQGSEAVETQAKITVNFTISTN